MSLQVLPVGPLTVDRSLIYSIKFVIGTIPPNDPTVPQIPIKNSPVVPGTYLTAINLHNPRQNAMLIEKHALITLPQNPDNTRGKVGTPQRETLDAGLGLEIDCTNILDLLGEPDFDLTQNFLKGFVVIKPIDPVNPLDVVAVYTFSPFVR